MLLTEVQVYGTRPGIVFTVVVVGWYQSLQILGRGVRTEDWRAGVHVPEAGHDVEEQAQVEEELQHPGVNYNKSLQ